MVLWAVSKARKGGDCFGWRNCYFGMRGDSFLDENVEEHRRGGSKSTYDVLLDLEAEECNQSLEHSFCSTRASNAYWIFDLDAGLGFQG